MKHVKLIGWASMLFLLFLTSCRENNIDPVTTVILPEPVVLVESSVKGQVIDENQNPLASVSISIGDTEVMTDENGFFVIQNENMNKNGTHITANKFGYFFNSKMINPSLGQESFVLFQMLEKTNVGSFNTANGGQFKTSNGDQEASVTFGANSIMYENGTPYSGTVEVSAKWLDPTHDLISARMPGDLIAIDTENELVQLATYGMVVVELEAPNGTPLQIAEGNTATISLPVPAEILNQAPNTIPLWSFDEETGYWVEESSATLDGNMYTGEVSHFSYWNCDAPFPVVEFEASVVLENGNPVVSTLVAIGNDNVGVRYAYTDSEGKVYGKVPKDETLTITVLDQCQTELYSAEIGPYAMAVVLDPIVVTTLEESSITGSLVKCDGSPVTNGYAFIQGPVFDIYLEVDDAGNFDSDILLCAGFDGTFKGFDLDVPLTSGPVSVSIPTNGGAVDVGEIEVCNAITEIVRVIVPDFGYDETYFIYSASDNTPSGEGVILNVQGGGTDSAFLYMQIEVDPLQTGSVQISYFSFMDAENPDIQDQFFFCQGSTGDFACPEFDVITNEGSGGVFEGTVTGDFSVEQNVPGTTHEITVEVNVILE